MKKLAIILIFMLALGLPLRARAQSADWVTLQSDAASLNSAGQTINLSLNASLDTVINGASLILHYDPACYKIAGHQAGSLLPGATAFVQEQPGQLDLTYYFLGQGKGLTGEGSLITIQLQTLQLCAGDLSVTPESITLGVLDDKGMAFNLKGVEYRSLVVHLVPGNDLPAATPKPAAAALPANSSVAPPPASGPGLGVVLKVLAVAAGLFFGLILIAGLFFLLLRRFAPRQGAALMHTGGTIPLPGQRTQLGRHIEIVHKNGAFYVVDAGSRLGVFLNGKRIGSGYHPVSHGDRVQLGQEVSYQFVNGRRNSPQQG